MTRKVIQIACQAPAMNDNDGFCYSALFALCDDGSIWKLSGREFSRWERVESVPQTGKKT